MLPSTGQNMATIDVSGMTCAVCVSRVENIILDIDGITNVAVNLAKGTANFSGEVDVETVIKAVNESSYKASRPINYFQKWNAEKQKYILKLKLVSVSLIYSLFAILIAIMAMSNKKIKPPAPPPPAPSRPPPPPPATTNNLVADNELGFVQV